MEILVFGGTSEGRELAEWLSARGTCDVVACSATEYGGELVSGLPHVDARIGALDDDAKERLVLEHDFACIIDATHPFAAHVTASIEHLATSHGIPLVRIVRAEQSYGSAMVVEDVAQAAHVLSGMPGNILLTTGSKDLATFVSAIPDFTERLFARVLPVADSVAHARELGIPASHLVAMQGPFSTEFNEALMRELSINVMVTKASGAAGGFAEKIAAAHRCGVSVVVIGRPRIEEGFSLDEAKRELEVRYGA